MGDEIMKYTEIKPGMLLKDIGLIIAVDIECKDKPFMNPNFTFWELHDGGSLGPWRREFKEHEEGFKILYEQGTEEYVEHISKIIIERAAEISKARDDIAFLSTFRVLVQEVSGEKGDSPLLNYDNGC